MAEYINQDDTIEVLDRVCKACDNENCYRHKGREYCPVMAVIDGIKDLPIADVQPVNRWISVKDRVPEAGVHVLVTDGIHMMVTWCEYVDNQCLWVDNYYTYVNVRFKEVTHWMPLPEFPKED